MIEKEWKKNELTRHLEIGREAFALKLMDVVSYSEYLHTSSVKEEGGPGSTSGGQVEEELCVRKERTVAREYRTQRGAEMPGELQLCAIRDRLREPVV